MPLKGEKEVRAEEMVQEVRQLLHKHEELSLDSRKPGKRKQKKRKEKRKEKKQKPGAVMYAGNPSGGEMGRGGRGIPVAHWPASLASLVKFRTNEMLYFKQKVKGT